MLRCTMGKESIAITAAQVRDLEHHALNREGISKVLQVAWPRPYYTQILLGKGKL